MYKVYIVNDSAQYSQMFRKEGWKIVSDMQDADLVQFTGGADVSPYLYGEEPHPTTHNDPDRDEYEVSQYHRAQALGIPCAGICRGGQFLNVMNGGTLYQDVNGHASGSHFAHATAPIGSIVVTSTHHQMMRPSKRPHEILMSTRISTKREFMMGGKVFDLGFYGSDDVEAVFYPETKTLCFQPHPEFNTFGGLECREAYFFFINNYLLTDDDNMGSDAENFPENNLEDTAICAA